MEIERIQSFAILAKGMKPVMAEQQKSYQKVLTYLKESLISGKLSLGQPLPPERELAERLDISRNSVREAIRQLEHMGFLLSNQGAGNFICCNIQQNLQDSFNLLILLHKINYRQLGELRSGLEMQAASLAIDQITTEQITQLQDIVREMQICSASRGNILDKRLHEIIAEASGNELIIQILRALSGTIDRFISDMRQRIFLNYDAAKQLQYAHEQIVDAFRCRDRVQLILAVKHHFNIVNTNMYNQESEKTSSFSKDLPADKDHIH
jgi:GntR family transcriptional repressor for pyruvate dehydrogenase complex